jgi:hypothetical protein
MQMSMLKRVSELHKIRTQAPRVGTVSNAAVQHGPVALPNLLCTPSVAQNLCPRNGPANA